MPDVMRQAETASAKHAHADPLLTFIGESFNAAGFRQWVSALQPTGPMLAQKLPGAIADDSTLYFCGVDLLRREGYVDQKLFASLASRFPQKIAQLEQCALDCGLSWAAPPRRFKGAAVLRRYMPLAIFVIVMGSLAWILLDSLPPTPSLLTRTPAQQDPRPPPGNASPTNSPPVEDSTVKAIGQVTKETQAHFDKGRRARSAPPLDRDVPSSGLPVAPAPTPTTTLLNEGGFAASSPCSVDEPTRTTFDEIAYSCLKIEGRTVTFSIIPRGEPVKRLDVSKKPEVYERDKHCVYEKLVDLLQVAAFTDCAEQALSVSFSKNGARIQTPRH